jgi:hypothetical protein
MIGENIKTLEDVPEQTLQMALDNWEDVQGHFAQMRQVEAQG